MTFFDICCIVSICLIIKLFDNQIFVTEKQIFGDIIPELEIIVIRIIIDSACDMPKEQADELRRVITMIQLAEDEELARKIIKNFETSVKDIQ